MVSVSRREFLRISGITAAATLAAACTAPSPAPSAPGPAAPTQAPVVAPTIPTGSGSAPTAPAGEAPSQYNEAPMLAERVAAGELPPVDERLPVNPVVWPVWDSIGLYGGTMRRSHSGTSDAAGPTKLTRRRLNWFNPDLTVRPDLGEGWEINDDASEWTFHLRQGGKWSDGELFTSRDFRFWYEDFLLNTELTPAPSSRWKAGTGDAEAVYELDTPDDFTVIFRFVAPKPLFLYDMGTQTPFAPAHYMEQFHPKYTDEADLNAQATAAGFESWAQLFANKDTWYYNPERPSVDTWLAVNDLSQELFIMERNPYFMGVDPEGNQLPYIDKVQHRLRQNADVFALWIINGEIDFQGRSIPDFTLMKENEANGNYTVVRGFGEGHQGMNPNHAAKNPLVREFFQNRNCRIAMSLAMNREEINDLIYDGERTPRQYSPTEGSPQYYEKASNVYLDYDPDEANRLLDQEGYDQRDADGFRLWKDGSGPVSWLIEGRSEQPSDEELMWIAYLEAVGLKPAYRGQERSLYDIRHAANEMECGNWGGDRAHLPLVDPRIFLGTISDRPWAGAWGLWKNNPNDPNGEPPPEDHWIREIWRIWDEVAVEPDMDRATELFKGILDIWAEELPMICTVGQDLRSIIMKNDMRNYSAQGKPFWGDVDDAMDAPTLFYVNPEEYVR
jgi:peptide/nickel transport system substrate-binding protein